MKTFPFYQPLRLLVVLGNVLFILWITYNGIDEGFSGTIYQKISYVSMMGLLLLNSVLLFAN